MVSSAHQDLDPDALDRMRHSVEAGVMAGFQMASGAGPLCEEPLWGIVFEVSQPPKQAPAESLSINTMLDQLA